MSTTRNAFYIMVYEQDCTLYIHVFSLCVRRFGNYIVPEGTKKMGEKKKFKYYEKTILLNLCVGKCPKVVSVGAYTNALVDA